MRIYVILTLLLSSLVHAEEPKKGLVLGLSVGTLGIGLEATLAQEVFAKTKLRFMLNGMSTEENTTESGNDYTASIDLLSAGALLDYYPGSSGFRMTGGLLLNKNKLNLNASGNASGTYNIGGVAIPTAGAVIDSSVRFNDLAPYLGVGYTSMRTKELGWGYGASLGVLLQGSPKVDLSVTDPSNTVTAADIAREQAELEEDLKGYNLFPHISFSTEYKF